MISKGNHVKLARFVLPSVKKQKHDFQVFFVDQAGHRKNSLRQRHTKHKKVDEGV